MVADPSDYIGDTGIWVLLDSKEEYGQSHGYQQEGHQDHQEGDMENDYDEVHEEDKENFKNHEWYRIQPLLAK